MRESTIPVEGVVTKIAEIDITAGIDAVFSYISSEESLPKFLKRYGPIHGVARWQTHKGPWSFAGAYRTLYFEGGDTLREELLSFQPPAYFAYSISEFSSFARHLANIAYGEFTFETAGDTTHVTWRYSFKPKNFFASIPLTIFMNLYFKKYMEQALQVSKDDIEKLPG